MISAKIQRNGSKRELLRRVDLLNNVSGIESWEGQNFFWELASEMSQKKTR